MGTRGSKPVTDKQEQGSGNGLRYAVASRQGWQRIQGDAYCAAIQVSDKLKDWSFFAVFDGHKRDDPSFGGEMSAYCAEHLLENILNTDENSSSDFIDRIRSGFLNLDQSMRAVPGIGESTDEDSYYYFDECGTTAVCAFVTPEQLYIANCGNCRALLYNSAEPIFATEDHKPTLENEKKRITNAKGYIREGKVNDELAVSRSLGNYRFKKNKNKKLNQCEQVVSPEPEIFVRSRNEKDEFLVIASSGVFHRVDKNEKLCEFIQSRLRVTDDLVTIVNEIIDTFLHKNYYYSHNMSIALVTFPAAPTPSPEAVEKDRNLERDIERKITKIISVPEAMRDGDYEENRCGRISVQRLLYTLRDKEKYSLNLPPDCNFGTKRGFIERIFKRCYHRGKMLRKLTEETIDILLDKDDGDYKSLVEQVLDKLNRNISDKVPSVNNTGTVRSLSHIALQPSSQGPIKRECDLSIVDTEPPAKKTK